MSHIHHNIDLQMHRGGPLIYDKSSGGSRMVIKGGLNNEDLRLTLKINGDLPLCNSDL